MRPHDFVRHLLHAVRRLKQSPGYSITAILTLALGIGASTAIFTVVDSVVIKPLSYRDSGRLVALWQRLLFLGPDPVGPNPRHADVWSHRASTFTGIALVSQAATGLAIGADHPQLVGTVMATPGLFDVLEVKPMLGRLFVPEDGLPGRDSVAVLTYHLWRNTFLADPAIVSKSVRLGDAPRQVIGVLPETFHFPNRNALRSYTSAQAVSGVPEPAVFVPAVLKLEGFSWTGDFGNWVALARLKPGVTIGRAQTELDSITPQLLAEMPAGARGKLRDALKTYVQPLQEAVTGGARTALWFLLAAVLGLMAIASLNLASGQLARTLSRQRESGIRAALGASGWRLAWHALLENMVLAAAGGAAGVWLALEAIDLFRLYAPVDLPRLAEIELNGAALRFSIALAFASALLFSLLPALNLARTRPQSVLERGGQRGGIGARHDGRVQRWLIGLQVSGGTILLLATGLFATNLLRLAGNAKAFETGPVALAQVTLTPKTHAERAARVAFIDGVLGKLRSLPGVESAGFISAVPFEGEAWIESMRRTDRPATDTTPMINVRWAGPGYFEAMRHRLVAGRWFEERDREANNVILTEGEAKALWPEGARAAIGGHVLTQSKEFTVIGVVADSHSASLKAAPVKVAYLHYANRAPGTVSFLVRGGGPAGTPADALVARVREAIWQYDPGVTITRANTMDSQVWASLAAERMQTLLLTGFGIAALALAMLGIHGVLSQSVTRRTREIGVRMALGATPSRVYRDAFGEAAAPVLGGLAAGLLASMAIASTLDRLLFDAAQLDHASTMLKVSLLFVAAAAVAAYLPARRAASVDPMESLRSE